MKNTLLKIIVLGAAGGSFLILPIFSLAQGSQDFPVMEMTMTVDREAVRPGEFLNYTINFQNNGQWTAFDVELENSFPKKTSLESTSFHATNLSKRKIEYTLPDFVPGDGQTIFIKLRVDEDTEIGTTLINEAVLNYKDGRERTRYLVTAQARTLVGTGPANGKFIPTAQAKEITAAVGSHALLVNLGLAFLVACFGVILLTKIRIRYRVK